jgi:branched-subunit amino acid transport protein
MMMDASEAVVAIAGMAVLTVLTRGAFFLPKHPVPVPPWLMRALRFGPLAALVAVVAPEVLLTKGLLLAQWPDARVFAALAAGAYFWWRQGVLGTIVVGMAVLLACRLGLGW